MEEAGYTVLIQAWDFRPGENFVLGMHKAASETQKTIMILSEHYLSAEYTHPDWAAAFVQDPQGHEQRLIPIWVKACHPTGLLQPIIYIDLVGLAEQDARIAILGAFSSRAKPTQAPIYPGASRNLPNSVPFPDVAVSSHVIDSIMTTGADDAVSSAQLQPHLIRRPAASLSPIERLHLIQKLNDTPAQQLNMLMFALEPPSGLIPPMPAPQGDRTAALLSWAAGEGGCGLAQVQELLKEIIK